MSPELQSAIAVAQSALHDIQCESLAVRSNLLRNDPGNPRHVLFLVLGQAAGAANSLISDAVSAFHQL